MPTLTLTIETLDALGVSRADFQESTPSSAATRAREGMSRGFDVTRTVHVIVLASGEGVVLTKVKEMEKSVNVPHRPGSASILGLRNSHRRSGR
jgi:hypothetical protein